MSSSDCLEAGDGTSNGHPGLTALKTPPNNLRPSACPWTPINKPPNNPAPSACPWTPINKPPTPENSQQPPNNPGYSGPQTQLDSRHAKKIVIYFAQDPKGAMTRWKSRTFLTVIPELFPGKNLDNELTKAERTDVRKKWLSLMTDLLDGLGGSNEQNPRPEPTLTNKLAFQIVQHLATNSLCNWQEKTFKVVVGEAPTYYGLKDVKEVAKWWQKLMVGLLNESRAPGEEEMSTDEFPYLKNLDAQIQTGPDPTTVLSAEPTTDNGSMQ